MATEKTTAAFALWQCGCSDVRADVADLPVQCPGHAAPVVQEPEVLDVLTEFVGVHECGARPCEVSR